MKSDTGEGDEVKCSMADSAELLEALEFKVKKDLQVGNLTKYHQIAMNTQRSQNYYASMGFQTNQQIVYQLQKNTVSQAQLTAPPK